jgi:hypothetical protein
MFIVVSVYFVKLSPETFGYTLTCLVDEFHNLYASPNIITVIIPRRVRWVEHTARMGETRNEHEIFVGKPERRRLFGRLRSR